MKPICAALLTTISLAALIIAMPATAQADALTKTGGNLALAPDESWAIPMQEEEMAEARGGYAGLAFSVFFTGSVANMSTNFDTSGVTTAGAPDPQVTVGSSDVRIQTVIGNFAGASGIFQISQVPGSFNVVNNNLFVQIAIINSTGENLPNLAGLLGTNF